MTIEELQKGEYDIFHPTFFDDYFLPYLKGKPFVLTIHDMIPELYPLFFRPDDIHIILKRKLAPLAKAIIAVSENTKQDIVRILGIPEEKIHVVYHGCSFSSFPCSNCFISSTDIPKHIPFLIEKLSEYAEVDRSRMRIRIVQMIFFIESTTPFVFDISILFVLTQL